MPKRKKISYRKNAKGSYGGVQKPVKERVKQKNRKYYAATAHRRLISEAKDRVLSNSSVIFEEQRAEIETDNMNLIASIQQQKQELTQIELQSNTFELELLECFALQDSCNDECDQEFNPYDKQDKQTNNNSKRNRFSMDYIFEILNIGEYVSAKNIPNVLHSCDRIRNMLGSEQHMSQSSANTWIRCLPRLFSIYQCAVEFTEGIFKGDSNCMIRDCGSNKGTSLFSSNVSVRTDTKIRSYPILRMVSIQNVQHLSYWIRNEQMIELQLCSIIVTRGKSNR
eukprot:9527_1